MTVRYCRKCGEIIDSPTGDIDWEKWGNKASMSKSVKESDLKSDGETLLGSSPSAGTKPPESCGFKYHDGFRELSCCRPKDHIGKHWYNCKQHYSKIKV